MRVFRRREMFTTTHLRLVFTAASFEIKTKEEAMPDMLLYRTIILIRNDKTVYIEKLRMLERFIVTEWLNCEKQEQLPQNINDTKYKLI